MKKTRNKVLDYSTKIALVLIMVCSGLLVGCYEKESIDEEGKKPAAVYYIAGVVTDFNYGGALQGVSVKVQGDFAAVTTGTNGEFSIRLGAITPAPEGYAITYTLSGYDTVTKQIFISEVGEGLSSITTANIALRVTGTASENPPAPPVEGADTEVSAEELEEITEELNDMISALLTDEVKEDLKNEITAAMGSGTTGEITIGDPIVEVTEDGQIQSSVPVTFEKAAAAGTMTYAYTLTTGFEVVGDIEIIDNPATRAVGDVITDPTTIANFKNSVANELNLPIGFSTTPTTVDYPVPTGYRVVGYEIISRMETRKHTYLINGEYLSGKASTYAVTTVVPLYESHNGDNHGSHGSNPNAGGGSSI